MGWPTSLLLGPTHLTPGPVVRLSRFKSTENLGELLNKSLPDCDILIMSAAVADYTPAAHDPSTKIRRSEGQDLTLEFRPTPDLLARSAASARADQLLVGFALEPAQGLEASARAKLERKGIDLIVANPLETMEAPDISAKLFASPKLRTLETQPPTKLSKPEFAAWLLPILRSAWLTKLGRHPKAH